MVTKWKEVIFEAGFVVVPISWKRVGVSIPLTFMYFYGRMKGPQILLVYIYICFYLREEHKNFRPSLESVSQKHLFCFL